MQEHDELTFIENHEVIRLLEAAGGRRTRLPSPDHSPPPEEHPKFVMPLAERSELLVYLAAFLLVLFFALLSCVALRLVVLGFRV